MITETQQIQIPESEAYARSVASIAVTPDARYGGFCAPYWSQLILNTLPLLLADILAIGGSLGCTYGVNWLWPGMSVDFGWLLMLSGLTIPVTFALFGLYPGTGLNAVTELAQVALATTLVFAIFLISAITYSGGTVTISAFVVMWISVLIMVPVYRDFARTLASSFDWWGVPVLLFGRGEKAQRLYNHYSSHPRLGIRPVTIVDDWSNGVGGHYANGSSLLSDRVKSLRRQHDVFWAVITMPLSDSSAVAVRSYLATFPHVLVVSDAEGLPSVWNQMFDCGNLSAIRMTNTLLLPLPRLFKALIDYVLAILGGLLCLPLIAAIVLLIKLTSPGPALYAQRRIGKGNRLFSAWKFRTMVVNADEVLQQYLDSDPKLSEEWERDHKLKNDPRITTVGYWLRKTSLDELPQIWNVLRGEMSVVGPRPIVSAEIPKYGNWFELYERVTPGITGLWQISGRNNTTYDMRVAFDCYYILNWSLWLDLYILARTIKVVMRREGAY